MNQGIRITKLERDLQTVISQQQFVLQKLTEVDSWIRSSQQQLASTPRHSHYASFTSNPPQYLQLSAPTQQHQQFPSPATAVSQPNPPPPAIPRSHTLQPKKLVTNDKALPSGAIEERLSAADDVIARYPNLKGGKVPTLAVKLAKEAFFGEKIMKQCTPLGGRELPGLPTTELQQLKEALYSTTPQYWSNIADFESVWSDCIASIGQVCKRLCNK